MRLVFVTKETLGEWFEKAKPLIQRIASDSRGRLSETTIRASLESGDYWLAVTDPVRACLIAQPVTWETGTRELRIIGLVGSGMRDWLHLESQITARARGFDLFSAGARPGWARVLRNRGWTLTHVTLEKSLDHADT